PGFHVRTSRKKAGELIASKERLLKRRFPRNPAVIGVRKYGPPDILINAALGQNRLAFHRVIGSGWMNLPIEIVEQRRNGPLLFVLAIFPRISVYARFHRQHMAAQAVRLYEFTNDRPGLLPIRH